MSSEQEMRTIPLGDLAEICLGKVILKDDIVPDGNAKVASISNMTEQGLVFEDMEMTNATEEDKAKYEIRNNDVLITCRGTKFRSVLVENKKSDLVIASGNLMILRCKEAVDAAVVHLYLQSPVGEETIIKQFQGKNSINIGKKQLNTLEIPVLSEQSKSKMVQDWNLGRKKYADTIIGAEREWKKTKSKIENYLNGKDNAENELDRPVTFSFEEKFDNKNESNNIPRQTSKRREDRLLIELD